MKSKLTMKIEGGACSDAIAWQLELDEGLGEAYRAVVTVSSEKVRTPADLRSQALGKRVGVTVEQRFENGLVTRHLNGIVTGVRHEGPASMRPEWLADFSSATPKGSLYAFVIEPTLVGLKLARRIEDYPDTTPLGVIQAVLARHNISPIVDGAYVDAESYSGKVRVVQDDETDWDFLHRILARYGLSYAFAHDDHGPERLYLSDGRNYPSCCALAFSELDGYTDGEVLNFSCVRQRPGSFPMKRFAASGAVGVDYVRDRFLRPMKSVALEREFGDAGSARSWFLSEAPAGYCEHADDKSVNDDFQRATDALKSRLALARNDWRGETASVAAMPGKVIALAGFLDATGQSDRVLKAKVVRSHLAVRLGDDEKDSFSLTFDAMDYSNDAERRWVLPERSRPSACRRVFEAVVCDRNGDWSETQAKNTIVVSPRSTPETPWIFLVATPNGGKGAVMDVAMTMPLGGRRQGLYRFPRVGERVLIEDLGDRLVLAGYVPDRSGSFGDFPEEGDTWTRRATALRYAPPIGDLAAHGVYDEIGFSTWYGAVEQVQQRIVDGTCGAFLRMQAVELNDVELYNAAEKDDVPKVVAVREEYFANPGKDAVAKVEALAKELVAKYKVADRPATAIRLRSIGSVVAYGQDGIELTTPGEFRINAGKVTINGYAAVDLQSTGVVRAAVGASSSTVNADGAVLRSRKLLDVGSEYDSSVVVGAQDGVSVAGANVRLNGLFTTSVNDALGAGAVAANGELRLTGAAVDLATVARDDATKAFQQLNETSGLNEIEKTLSAWKAGSTPDGGPRSIVDRGVNVLGLTDQSTKRGSMPGGCFRGTLSGLTQSAANSSDVDGRAGESAVQTVQAFEGVPGGKPNLTVTRRELVRTKAFLEQMKTQSKTLETVVNSVVSGKSSSVTIHGHQLDLNVQVLNDLSENHKSDGASGAGS